MQQKQTGIFISHVLNGSTLQANHTKTSRTCGDSYAIGKKKNGSDSEDRDLVNE